MDCILSTCYKIFAKVIYKRLRRSLQAQQAPEQFGFMPNRSTQDALFILEAVISKSIDKHAPLWFASLDLRKAFDRVEWPHLFNALREQGVSNDYISLIGLLYSGQIGGLSDGKDFAISRGVRQGNILSPLLFNCVLEYTIKRWKAKLQDHGVKLSNDSASQRLTNIRFADDLIIFASNLQELIHMLELVVEELESIGLSSL